MSSAPSPMRAWIQGCQNTEYSRWRGHRQQGIGMMGRNLEQQAKRSRLISIDRQNPWTMPNEYNLINSVLETNMDNSIWKIRGKNCLWQKKVQRVYKSSWRSTLIAEVRVEGHWTTGTSWEELTGSSGSCGRLKGFITMSYLCKDTHPTWTPPVYERRAAVKIGLKYRKKKKESGNGEWKRILKFLKERNMQNYENI